MKTKILSFLILLLITNCGFSPVYESGKKLDYHILINDKEGERLINNLIQDEISRFSNPSSQSKIIIKITTEYDKSILTKDSKGSATDYTISMVTDFEIKEGTSTNNIIFKDKQVIKNNSDIFEQNNVEDATKRNFAISAANKLRLALIDY